MLAPATSRRGRDLPWTWMSAATTNPFCSMAAVASAKFNTTASNPSARSVSIRLCWLSSA
jgi:hypothetical protein